MAAANMVVPVVIGEEVEQSSHHFVDPDIASVDISPAGGVFLSARDPEGELYLAEEDVELITTVARAAVANRKPQRIVNTNEGGHERLGREILKG